PSEPKERRAATQPSDAALAGPEGWLRDKPRRQVASGFPAGVQPAQEWLRQVLRDLLGVRGLFQAWPRRRQPALRAGGARRSARIHDESSRRPRGSGDRGVEQVEGTVSAEPAFHGATLALGGPERRGRVETHQEASALRLRITEN